jgi:uncharacterized protein
MSALAFLPELRALDSRRHLVRIPHECDVPLTDRVRQLLDAPEMRRLARISQLGLVALVGRLSQLPDVPQATCGG